MFTKDLAKLVRITDARDLRMWGEYMGHSGGFYSKWVCDTPIWYFLTILDPAGWPHATVHIKQRAWLFKGHPRDRDEDVIAPSTAYDDVDVDFNRPITFDGVECVIMDASHKDKDGLVPAERSVIASWYDMVVIPDSAPIPRRMRFARR